MKFRKLRIARSVGWGLLAVMLCVLWVRSDRVPQHHTFDINTPRLIAAGDPESSVLLHRISHRKAGPMLPLATSVVDRRAVELIRQRIANLPPSKEAT